MFLPATHRYVRNPLCLVLGKIYHIDSGMGGSYSIHYRGKGKGDHYKFRRVRRPDLSAQNYSFREEELYEKVYILPPESEFERKAWDKERQAHPEHPEGWFPADPSAYKYRVMTWHKETWVDSGQVFSYAIPPSLAYVIIDLRRLTWIPRELPWTYYTMLEDGHSRDIYSGSVPVFRLESDK